jgi:hypothetical protein
MAAAQQADQKLIDRARMAEKHGTYIFSQSIKWQLGHKPPGSENGS